MVQGSPPRRWSGLELSLSTQFKRNEEEMQRSKADFFSLSPQVSWSLLSSGRLRTQFKWTHLSSSPADKSLSYQVSEGRGKGENYDWGCHFDYRLNRHVTSSIRYNGEKEPGRMAKHTGKMEVKAYF
jgi:outer membrane usher protein FimD/PapC